MKTGGFFIKLVLISGMPAVPAPNTLEESRSIMNILLVDDDQNLVKTLMLGLKKEFPAARIEYCYSGNQALNLCETEAFDVVVSDFKMPGMTGIELFKQIRAGHEHPFLILTTAYGSKDLEKEAVKYADAYISKPFDIPILIKFMSQLLAKKTSWGKMNNVLVLEDDSYLRRLITKVLHSANMQVYEAASIRHAQELLDGMAFDVFISDVKVPDGLGVDLIKRNRALLSKNGTVVILVTGEAQYRAYEEELGVEMFLEKPISVPDLLTLVQRWSPSKDIKGTLS